MTDKEINSLAAQLYRGARMGTQTLRTLLTKVKDKELYDELCEQLSTYGEMESKIYNDLVSRNIIPKDVNPLQSASAWMTIQFKTMFNKKPSHIAELLINGNTMGIIGITKLLNKNKGNKDALIDYGLEFINLVDRYNENLKQYL